MKLSIDAVIAAYGLLFGIFWIFAYCYIGDYVSSCFDRIDGMLWQTHWYHCPTELQTLLIFIIRRAQVPFRFDGLKMFFCNLVTFATVSLYLCSEGVERFACMKYTVDLANVYFFHLFRKNIMTKSILFHGHINWSMGQQNGKNSAPSYVSFFSIYFYFQTMRVILTYYLALRKLRQT